VDVRLVIDNEHIGASGGAMFERRNPISGQTVTHASAVSVTDAIKSIESTHAAFQSWSATGPTERRKILLEAADKLEGKVQEISEAMAGEIGASGLWGGFNVFAAAALIREAAALTTQIQGETIPTDKPGTLSITLRQPVGVVLSIVLWNGPVILAARAIAHPIACGNSVISRASEMSPKTHALVADAFCGAGLPAGVLNFIVNAPHDAPQIIDTLISHPAVRRRNFTGSTRVGRIVAELAARNLKRCLLQLGGKAPFVVLDDTDIDGAVSAAIFGAFLYQEQICMSTERFAVDESEADVFVEKFAKRAAELRAGDPIANVANGANVVVGGHADGVSMDATIVDHVQPGMTIHDEETFGPVATIVRVRGIEEAVRVANDTDYGLAAAIFGRDVLRALEVAKRIDAGHVHVNGATVQNEPQAPYGGMKKAVTAVSMAAW
jgi:acyl-CoA reductase-like NAD-dependent aldehyde dehydrogenase